MDIKLLNDIFKDIYTEQIVQHKLDTDVIISLGNIIKAINNNINSIDFPIDFRTYINDINDLKLSAYTKLLLGVKFNFLTFKKYSNYLSNYITSNTIELTNELNRLIEDFKISQSKIQDLLLVNQYSAGNYILKTYCENFNNTNNIDFERTNNININTNTHKATLSNTSVISITTNDIDVTIQPFITKSYLTSGFINTDNINLFASTIYDYQMVKSSDEQTILQILIDLSKINIAFNKLTMTIDNPGIYSSRILLSNDNIEYVSAYQEDITHSIDISLTDQTRYIKILITKETYDSIDDSNYIYYFRFGNLKLYNSQINSYGELYFKPIEVDTTWDHATLEVKDNIPKDTSIDYYLSVDGINYSQVSPINKQDVYKNLPYIYSKQGTTKQWELVEIDNTTSDWFNTVNSNDIFLNEVTNDYIKETIEVYRGVNDFSDELDIITDDYINNGWILLPTGYTYTYCYLKDKVIKVELSKYENIHIYVNDKLYTDDFILPVGINKISVLKEHHNTIHTDILKPNAEFIFTEKLNYVPYTNFVKSNSTNIFSIITINKNLTLLNRIIIKSKSTNDNIFIVRGNVIMDNNNKIYLKAIFKSNTNISPELFGYNIKLSYAGD